MLNGPDSRMAGVSAGNATQSSGTTDSSPLTCLWLLAALLASTSCTSLSVQAACSLLISFCALLSLADTPFKLAFSFFDASKLVSAAWARSCCSCSLSWTYKEATKTHDNNDECQPGLSTCAASLSFPGGFFSEGGLCHFEVQTYPHTDDHGIKLGFYVERHTLSMAAATGSVHRHMYL